MSQLARPELRREISPWSLFALAFGTIIGVGWITVMGVWLTQAGPLGAIVGFVGGGLIMAVIGICYAEAAAMFPVSGGEVAYIYEMFGSRFSFAAGWILAFDYIALTSFEAISIGWILSALLPGFEGPVIYSALGEDVHLWALLAGIAVMALLVVINYRGARLASNFQGVLTLALLIATAAFVVAGLGWGDTANLEPAFVRDTSGAVWIGILAVLSTTPFWFAGFDTIPQAMGELEERADLRVIPKVIVLAVGLALVFYCLVILSTAMTLPRADLLGKELPVAGSFEAAFRSAALGKTVLIAGLLGLITTWNAMFFAATRLIFALGRGRMIPAGFGSVHARFGTPHVAIIFVGVLGSIGAFFGKNAIVPIVNAGAICLAFIFFSVVLGTILLRYREPGLRRPYRVPGGNAILGIAAVLAFVLLIISATEPFRANSGMPLEWMLILLWLAAGAVFWLLAGRTRNSVSESERRWLILNLDDDS